MVASFAKCSFAAVLMLSTVGICQAAQGIGLRGPDASSGQPEGLRFYGAYGQGFMLPASGSWPDSLAGSGLSIGEASRRDDAVEFGLRTPLTANVSASLSLFRATPSAAGVPQHDGLAVAIDGAWRNGIGARFAYTTGRALTSREGCVVLCSAGDTALALAPSSAAPEQSVYGELSWRHPRLGFRAGVEARYLTRRYSDEFSSANTAAYFNANAHVGIEQKFGAWRIQEYARIDNLTNRSYNGADGAYPRPFDFAGERSYLIGIRAGYSW